MWYIVRMLTHQVVYSTYLAALAAASLVMAAKSLSPAVREDRRAADRRGHDRRDRDRRFMVRPRCYERRFDMRRTGERRRGERRGITQLATAA